MISLDKYTSPRNGYGLQYGASKTREYSNNTIKTNGKTEIRVRKGTKSSYYKWSLTWKLPVDMALQLEQDIDGTAGVDAMSFTEPVTGKKYLVVCDEGPTTTADSFNSYTVTADVREETR